MKPNQAILAQELNFKDEDMTELDIHAETARLPFKKSHAFIIGINKYLYIKKLRTAVNDAKKLAELLEKEQGFNVHPPLIDATYDDIGQLKDLMVEIVEPEDRVLFYFAGHGIALDGEDRPEGCIAPADARAVDSIDSLNEKNRFISMRKLNDFLARLPCKHLLLILDCCFAGAFRWSSLRREETWILPKRIFKERFDFYVRDPAWQVLASSGHDQTAFDVAPGKSTGKRDDEYMDHSPFAEALLKGLRGAADVVPADGGDGLITASELYVYLRRQVEPESVKEHDEVRQTPILFPLEKHDKGEFVFLHPRHRLNLPPIPDRNPYKGLHAFEEKDQDLFYGRENAIRDLIRKMKQSDLLVVTGASGSGKTSLIKAGLMTELQRLGFTISMMNRPSGKPMAALEKVLRKTGIVEEKVSLDKDVDLISERLVSGRNALIIDQFEELATRGPGEKENHRFIEFLKKLLDAVKETKRFRMILAIRIDSEPEFSVSALQEYWSEAVYKLTPPTVGEMREIIEKPIIQEVLAMEPPELVDRIIDDVSGSPGALPLLSASMSDLFKSYIDSGRMDRILREDDYKKIDGANGWICSRAAEVHGSLDSGHRETMRKIMLRMASMDGTKRVGRKVQMEELNYSERESARVNDVIDIFMKERLIVSGREDMLPAHIEPAHEALIRDWDGFWNRMREGGTDAITLRSRLRAAMEDYSAGKGRLWYDSKNLKPLKKQLTLENTWLNLDEVDFVKKSLKLKATRRTLAVLLFALILMGSFLGVHKARIGKADFLTSEAQLHLIDDPIRAIRLAEKAHRFDRSPNVLRVLSAAAATTVKRPFYSLAMRHDRPVNAAVFSPTGDRMITVSSDRTAKLWDLKGALLATLPHDDVVYSAAFSPDGSNILTVSRDNAARLWNSEGDLQRDFPHEKRIASAVFSPDGLRVLTASEDNTARLWSARGELLKKYTYINDINAASFSSDGSRILIISKNKVAMSFALESGDGGVFNRVLSAEFSPNGKQILVVSLENTVTLHEWDGAILTRFDNPGKVVASATFSPDGANILTICMDGEIRLWDLNARVLATFHKHGDIITSASFSPDGGRILTASMDATAKLWDLDGNLIADLDKHDDAVVSAVFSPDGSKILTASRDNTARLWELREQPAMDIHFPKMAVAAASFSPDGRRILISSGKKALKIWDSRTCRTTTITENADITHVKFSPDGARVLTTAADKSARLRDLSGNLIAEFSGHTGNVNFAAFSPDGAKILTASYDRTAKLWDAGGALLADLDKHTNGVNSAIFSPDGRMILTASFDKTAKLWDLNGNLLTTFNAHILKVTSAIFSPGGDRVLTFTVVGRLYDLNGTPLAEIGSKGGAASATFSPDGMKILTASNDKTAKLWDLKGNLLTGFIGHDGFVYTAAFSPDGDRALTSSADNTVKLWNMDGAILSDFTGHEGRIQSAEFSPDGSRILSASADGYVILRFTPETIVEWLKTAKIPPLPEEKGFLVKQRNALYLIQYKIVNYFSSF